MEIHYNEKDLSFQKDLKESQSKFSLEISDNYSVG